MAGKKDQVIVAVVGGLTETQVKLMKKDIVQAKKKCAPYSKGRIAGAKNDDVGKLLRKGMRLQGIQGTRQLKGG